MAFDIYGNNLRAGFCEVHPDVPEHYPCYVCFQEIEKWTQKEQRERERQSKAIALQRTEVSIFKLTDRLTNKGNLSVEDYNLMLEAKNALEVLHIIIEV